MPEQFTLCKIFVPSTVRRKLQTSVLQ